MFDLNSILISLPGIFMALSIHECAHAYVAHLMGDDTAMMEGRVSINPIRHIDPIGFIMLLIAKIGWAKPVPVDERNFEHRKLGLFFVSIAGVVANLILAVILTLLLKLLLPVMTNEVLFDIIVSAILINVSLATFNLLPFPPLDGFRILSLVLPEKYEYKIYPFERYSAAILFLLVATGRVDFILDPIFGSIIGALSSLLY